jgi:hypothetical protein
LLAYRLKNQLCVVQLKMKGLKLITILSPAPSKSKAIIDARHPAAFHTATGI